MLIDPFKLFRNTIKFIAEISDYEVNFVDWTVHLDPDGNIWTSLPNQPTVTIILFFFTSTHLSYIKSSIKVSQFLQISLIYTKDNDILNTVEW